jgi:hypothetical protein
MDATLLNATGTGNARNRGKKRAQEKLVSGNWPLKKQLYSGIFIGKTQVTLFFLNSLRLTEV